MRYRKNVDVGMRRLARGVAQGDPEAAEAFLFKTAQNGTWFVPHEWKGPEPGGFPYASRLNRNRAYWVRLLGFLKWPGAAGLQRAVATQAPARREHEEEYWWGERKGQKYMRLDPAEAMHELGQVKPFSKIGPEIADGIGGSVMEALAMEGVEFTFGLSGIDRAAFNRAKLIIRQLRMARKAWQREPRDPDVEGDPAWDRYQAVSKPLEGELWKIRNTIRTPLDRSWHGSAVAAEREAREAFDNFFGASNRHDAPKDYGRSFEHATRAVAWNCESDRGTEGRPRTRSYGMYGPHAPGRACNTVANRLIKRAVAPAVVVAIANQIMRYS